MNSNLGGPKPFSYASGPPQASPKSPAVNNWSKPVPQTYAKPAPSSQQAYPVQNYSIPIQNYAAPPQHQQHQQQQPQQQKFNTLPRQGGHNAPG